MPTWTYALATTLAAGVLALTAPQYAAPAPHADHTTVVTTTAEADGPIADTGRNFPDGPTGSDFPDTL
ncbi:hypothetical protein [Kitasatospora sp. NPDC097643]|uniref:hypothetical protein n=1 Tax=Kitasatospora sp. NPDC097643 TaxID=3157230 RepID=UPI00332CAD20